MWPNTPKPGPVFMAVLVRTCVRKNKQTNQSGGSEPGKRKWLHVTVRHTLSTNVPQGWAGRLAKASICPCLCKEHPPHSALITRPTLVCLVHANASSAGGSYIYKPLPPNSAAWKGMRKSALLLQIKQSQLQWFIKSFFLHANSQVEVISAFFNALFFIEICW